ncbi:MAG TPA: pectinesterase family protein [Opitutaceae bacterium]|nr:pectinesterase family protein [Opitutaceae bacterium]
MKIPGFFFAALMLISVSASAAGTPRPPDATVAADGSGQFKTVLDAIVAAPTASADRPWVIFVKAGTYAEVIYVQREKRFVRLVGENAVTTRITASLSAKMPGADGKPLGTFRTATLHLDADDFTVENLTIENAAGAVGQALALRVDGDRVVFRGCRFLGWQDTILANRGRQYFVNCHIAGATDFIFGGATAFFEACEIHCAGSGYITAASTPREQPYGFVFKRCRITAATPGVKTYLGRPWRDHAAVAFVETEMSDAVRPVGWQNWSRPEREKTARYSEFGNTGPGAAREERVGWMRPLSADEAKALTTREVLRGADDWNPASTP